MKIRKAKKQIKKVVGFMTANGLKVVNVVSNPDYLGGTCVERDEDCYRCEITYTRKRYGAPLWVKARHEKIFLDIYSKVHSFGKEWYDVVRKCPYCGSENFEWMGDAFGDEETPYHCHHCDCWF